MNIGRCGGEERGINNTRSESKIGRTYYAINPPPPVVLRDAWQDFQFAEQSGQLNSPFVFGVVVSPLVIRKTFRPRKMQLPLRRITFPRGNKESKSFSLYATKLTRGLWPLCGPRAHLINI